MFGESIAWTYPFLPSRTAVLLAFSGLVVLGHRVEMGVLALFSHATAWVFLIVVEEPHMKTFYEDNKIRKHSTALTKQLKTKILPKIAATARAQYYRVHSWGDAVLSN